MKGGGRQGRQDAVGRQHQGMDRPGVLQVPEGSGEQGKMEKTGCKIICGAPTTLAVKGLLMMMMMMCLWLFPRLREFLENVRSFISRLRLKKKMKFSLHALIFHCLCQNWSTVVQRAKMTVTKCSRSCV